MKNRWYRRAVQALVWMNVFDGLVTITLVYTKVTVEKNPLMSYLLDRGPLMFGLVKVGVSLLIGYGFWRIRRSPSAWGTLLTSLSIYTSMVLYQLWILAMLAYTYWSCCR